MGASCCPRPADKFIDSLKTKDWVNLLSNQKQKQLLKKFVDDLQIPRYWSCRSVPLPIVRKYQQVQKIAKFVPNEYCYFGQTNNQIFQGKGLIFYANLTIYKGQFKQGSPDGIGRLVNHQFVELRSGKWENGQFKQGQLSSTNQSVSKIVKKISKSIDYNTVQTYEIHYNDESFYVGTIKIEDNLIYKHGKGRLNTKSGYRYTGGWLMNKRHGNAIVEQPNKSSFKGQFDEDYKRRGVLTINKLQYQGEWQQKGTLFTGTVKNIGTGRMFKIDKNNYTN